MPEILPRAAAADRCDGEAAQYFLHLRACTRRRRHLLSTCYSLVPAPRLALFRHIVLPCSDSERKTLISLHYQSIHSEIADDHHQKIKPPLLFAKNRGEPQLRAADSAPRVKPKGALTHPVPLLQRSCHHATSRRGRISAIPQPLLALLVLTGGLADADADTLLKCQPTSPAAKPGDGHIGMDFLVSARRQMICHMLPEFGPRTP